MLAFYFCLLTLDFRNSYVIGGADDSAPYAIRLTPLIFFTPRASIIVAARSKKAWRRQKECFDQYVILLFLAMFSFLTSYPQLSNYFLSRAAMPSRVTPEIRPKMQELDNILLKYTSLIENHLHGATFIAVNTEGMQFGDSCHFRRLTWCRRNTLLKIFRKSHFRHIQE